MKINGVGNVNKKDILSIFTREGKEAIKEGIITWEEAVNEYKEYLVKKVCKIGEFNDMFNKNYARIPGNLKDKLTPEELGQLVEAFNKCYNDAKNNTNE